VVECIANKQRGYLAGDEKEWARALGAQKRAVNIVKRPWQRLRAPVEIGRSHVKERDRVIRKDLVGGDNKIFDG